MPAPLFTTNPAEFSQLEGLYIYEQNPPGFIAGVPVGDVALVGQCVRGPMGKAVEITTESRFKEVFGGRDYGAGGTLIGEVWKALLNKKFGKIVVARVVSSTAVKASFTLEDTAAGGGAAICRLDASSPGLWGNSVYWKVEAATDGVATSFNLRLKYLGVTKLYENISLNGSDDNSLTVIGDDDANWITLTKLASGRPVNSAATVDGADADGYTLLGQTVAAFTSVAGTEPALADGDYFGTGEGIDLVKDYNDVGFVCVVGRQTAAIKAQMLAAAAAASDRLFLIWNGTHAETVANVITDAALYRSDRVVYCHNSPYTVDPETGTLVQTEPHVWMASILSQTDVDVHPASQEAKKLLAGISSLTSESLARADYKSLRAAGVASLEKRRGFGFVSGVTTSLTSGLTEITRRRMADFLQLSASERLEAFVAEKNTEEIRATMGGEIVAFSDNLRTQGRVVEDFAVDQESQNTEAGRAQGIEYVLWRVKLVKHILHLVLKTEIGTGVTIAENAA